MTTNPSSTAWSISFIVLALNEEENIEMTVDTILDAVGRSRVADYQIVLVNDGSTDKTPEIMERLAASNDRIEVAHNERNLGLGGAYKRGLRFATCDYVLIVAGDNAMPAEDMSAILGCLGKADIILPYLTNPKLRPLARRIGSAGFTRLINFLFGFHVHYYQGMVPRRELLDTITITTNSYAFPAEVVVKLLKKGATFVELPTPNTPINKCRSRALQFKRLLTVLTGVINLVREIRRSETAAPVPVLNFPTGANDPSSARKNADSIRG